MTIGEALVKLRQFQVVTGVTAKAYTCGPETFNDLVTEAGFDPKNAYKVQFSGAYLYPNPDTPEGEFYPCDFLEGMES